MARHTVMVTEDRYNEIIAQEHANNLSGAGFFLFVIAIFICKAFWGDLTSWTNMTVGGLSDDWTGMWSVMFDWFDSWNTFGAPYKYSIAYVNYLFIIPFGWACSAWSWNPVGFFLIDWFIALMLFSIGMGGVLGLLIVTARPTAIIIGLTFIYFIGEAIVVFLYPYIADICEKIMVFSSPYILEISEKIMTYLSPYIS